MNEDKKLDRMLNHWRCDYAADPWLEDRVWLRINRIETEEEKPSFWERLDVLRVPAIACGLLMLGVAGGIGVGEWQSRGAANPVEEERLADVYFQSINPVAMAVSHQGHQRGGER